MGEVTAACFEADRNADIADGVPERHKRLSFGFAQVHFDLGEGLLNQAQNRLKPAGTRRPFCSRNRTASAWALTAWARPVAPQRLLFKTAHLANWGRRVRHA